MKIFKAKKIKKKKRKTKFIVFILFFFFSYILTIKYLKENRLNKSILSKDVNYIDFNIKKEVTKKIDNVIKNPVNLLRRDIKVSNTYEVKKEDKLLTPVIKQEALPKNKQIYIYNTHQLESYSDYNVYDLASVMVNDLNKYDLGTILEEKSIKVYLDSNNLKYYNSYKASKTYLEEAKKDNPSLTYFFDIHRDSISKEKSTLTVDNKNYAKILFVVGSDNLNYLENKDAASKLNSIIERRMPGISRGIVLHGGKGYNGVYNQDVSKNVFLIEVGAKDNTKEEVINTKNILIDSIIEYVRGDV